MARQWATLVALVIPTVCGVEFEVTQVDFAALANGDSRSAVIARNALATTGALAMTGVPGLAAARAFLDEEALVSCMESDENVVSTRLADGSTRRTVAAHSAGGSAPSSMNSVCGAPASDLRLVIDLASRKLFHVLDNASYDVVMRPSYSTFSELMHSGEHLEHLHTYEGFGNPSSLTLHTHVDAGLLISMVAGTPDAAELWLELPTGDTVKVKYDANSVLFLAGEGCRTWLAPEASSALRPAPHALQVTAPRAWYGKMWLPPVDAVVEATGLPFSEHSRLMRTHAADDTYSAGCSTMLTGDDSYRRLGSASAEYCRTQDGDDGILCWAQCVSIEDLDCDPEHVACVDFETDRILDGSKHCDSHSFDECGPRCLVSEDDAAANNTDSSLQLDFRGQDGFCVGDGVTMYMDGFRSIFESNSPLCVNFWMTQWTLDTKFRFGWGIVSAFVVGITVEGLVKIRRAAHDAAAPAVLLLFLHFCQSVLGYLAMFVAMTYQVELFLAVCLGASTGHLAFNFKKVPPQTNDPCCAAAQQSDTLCNQDQSPEENGASTEPPGSCCCCSSTSQTVDLATVDPDAKAREVTSV